MPQSGFERFENFFKKFVIGGKGAHTYKWFNLLLDPRRHLQRLGFVYLGGGEGEKGDENFFNFFLFYPLRVPE